VLAKRTNLIEEFSAIFAQRQVAPTHFQENSAFTDCIIDFEPQSGYYLAVDRPICLATFPRRSESFVKLAGQLFDKRNGGRVRSDFGDFAAHIEKM
jgi:hypothetical protein